MRALVQGRQRLGWSQTRAASETGISRPHLSLLERGLRRPSASVAETLIGVYDLNEAEAAAVRGIAVKWAGRDSPFVTGVGPGAWEP
jgi:transcriptional regulator with XRE-family HTH domain